MACAIASQYDSGEEHHNKVHAPGWGAELALRYERRGARTVLAQRRHSGPMLVQKPLYPEGEHTCHGIVLHPPGGIVGGDRLALHVEVGARSSALLTTPGAAKWYRSAGAEARQTLRFDVAPGASLEWLPQFTITFDHAQARMNSEVVIDADGCYIGWELICLGRTASGERLTNGKLLTTMRVMSAGTTLWLERALIEGGSRFLDSPVGLHGQPISGTLIAVARTISNELLTACRNVRPAAGRGGVTRLPGLLVARYLGDRAEAAFDYFVSLWQLLRPALLNREAVAPRIWRT
jgi:urease accessory protein